MLRHRAPAVSALDGRGFTIFLHDETGTLNQAVIFVTDLGVLSSQRNDVSRSVIYGPLAGATLIRSRYADAAGGGHFRYIIVPEVHRHVRRLQDHILLLGPDAAQVVGHALGVVIIQLVRIRANGLQDRLDLAFGVDPRVLFFLPHGLEPVS